MDRCLILMSTFNGEKYLCEQIDSLLNQKNIVVDIFISDDKSSDNTVKILEEYKTNYSNIKYRVNKENKGFTYNFIDMLFDCDEDYDYYALCDQDDIWMSNKLEAAINKIKETNQSKVLYCSNLTLVNDELKSLGMQEKKDIHKNRYSGLISNIATGCSCVFDKSLLRLIRKNYPKDIYLHDYYIYLVAEFCGTVIYDTNSYILYRQHYGNQIGSNKKISLKRIKNFFKPIHKTSKLVNIFYNYYKNDIHPADLKKVEIVANYSKSLKNRFKLIFSGINSRNHKFFHLIQFLFNKF